ncbi:MAG: type I DNA topoisomerase [Hydrogenibacillus schlegelii]|nr:type I DNA topoisomerase [Hydrogenibacillus schlegelii]
MSESIVIVESPAKAKTIAKYLGRTYRVLASMGHVRDLPKSELGVDIEAGFVPKYITIRGKGEVLKALKDAAKKASRVYLASDPDREGEAIAWHLAQYLKLDLDAPIRVVFHEITERAVKESFRHPRKIDRALVDAQQARRILDRLVGYQISPLLWKKVKKGLSAGRVQSVAVKLIIDRENEIEAFVPEEYWTVDVHLEAAAGELVAQFYGYGEEKTPLRSSADVAALLRHIEGRPFVVLDVARRERRRKPPAPFTTSTLQQEASRKLGFRATRTMRVAQELYEGVPLGPEGHVGLITYMRTDSVRVSELAQAEARAYLAEVFGDAYVPATPPVRKARAGAQDAHEAIRPTSVRRTPEAVKPYLSRDQYRLYRLIWERFVASQMPPAVYDTTTVTIGAGDARFRAAGSVIKFDGFLRVYEEATEDRPAAEAREAKGGGKSEDVGEEDFGELRRIVPVERGETLRHLRTEPRQHFTQPPPRYSEAQLVKTMEELGIGRPSTYAPTIETIQKRGYVVLRDRRFHPTELGRLVTALLERFFPEIIDVSFTAKMEADLDRVEAGALDSRTLLETFYAQFQRRLEAAEAEMAPVTLEPEYAGVDCDVCGRPMVVKTGRYGKFLACSGYPECTNTKPYVVSSGARCPKCGQGELVERRSKRGRVFYGCSRFPECDFTTWDRPHPAPCPECGGLLVLKGRQGREVAVCTACGARFDPEALPPVEPTPFLVPGPQVSEGPAGHAPAPEAVGADASAPEVSEGRGPAADDTAPEVVASDGSGPDVRKKKTCDREYVR